MVNRSFLVIFRVFVIKVFLELIKRSIDMWVRCFCENVFYRDDFSMFLFEKKHE